MISDKQRHRTQFLLPEVGLLWGMKLDFHKCLFRFPVELRNLGKAKGSTADQIIGSYEEKKKKGGGDIGWKVYLRNGKHTYEFIIKYFDSKWAGGTEKTDYYTRPRNKTVIIITYNWENYVRLKDSTTGDWAHAWTLLTCTVVGAQGIWKL